MLDEIYASRMERVLDSGRTKPCLVTCEDAESREISVVVKLSNGCIEQEHNLALEALAAMLAADLNLPVPNFYVVVVDDAFVESLRGRSTAFHAFSNSCRLAFGSHHVQGHAPWITRSVVPKALQQIAAEVFIFDSIIRNVDRRPDKPNCLFSGDDIAIIDHELSFQYEIFWKPPFEDGGLDSGSNPDAHIFAPHYFQDKTELNFVEFTRKWKGISDDRFGAYLDAIPAQWKTQSKKLSDEIEYLKSIRDNIDDVVKEALKVFK